MEYESVVMWSVFEYIEFISALCFSCTLIINAKNYIKERIISSLFSALISLFFMLAIASALLESVINMTHYFYDFKIHLGDFLVVSFIAMGFLTWFIYMNYLSSEKIGLGVITLTFIAGLIVMGELLAKTATTINMVNFIGIIALSYLVYFSTRFFRNLNSVLKKRRLDSKYAKHLKIYSIGSLAFIISFIIILMGDIAVLTISKELARRFYSVGYTLVFFAVLILVIIPMINPLILEANLSYPYLAIFVTKDGNPVIHKEFQPQYSIFDPELASGIITAILNASQEIIGIEADLQVIKFDKFSIIAAVTKNIAGYLFVKRPTMILRTILLKAVKVIETKIDFTKDIILIDNATMSLIDKELDLIFEPLI